MPPLAASFAIAALFWAPTILCIDGILTRQASYSKVSLSLFLGAIVIACAMSWVLLCWGAFCSSQFKRIWPAVVWTIGSVLFLYIALPLLSFIAISGSGQYENERALSEFFRFWHPAFAFSEMMDNRSSGAFAYRGAHCVFDFALTMSICGAILLFFSWRKLKRSIGSKTQREFLRAKKPGASTS